MVTLTTTIRRVWPGDKRTDVVLDLPHGRERLAYCWSNTTKGQLIASICHEASKGHLPLVLELKNHPVSKAAPNGGWEIVNVSRVEPAIPLACGDEFEWHLGRPQNGDPIAATHVERVRITELYELHGRPMVRLGHTPKERREVESMVKTGTLQRVEAAEIPGYGHGV